MDVNAFLSHRRSLVTPSGEIAYTELGHRAGRRCSCTAWAPAACSGGRSSRSSATPAGASRSTCQRTAPARLATTCPRAALAEALADLCDGPRARPGRPGRQRHRRRDRADLRRPPPRQDPVAHPDQLRLARATSRRRTSRPIIEQARQGTLAPLMAGLAANPAAWPTHPLSMGYQYPERVSEDAWRDYLTGAAGTIERARDCERLLASLDAADIEGRRRPAARAQRADAAGLGHRGHESSPSSGRTTSVT